MNRWKSAAKLGIIAGPLENEWSLKQASTCTEAACAKQTPNDKNTETLQIFGALILAIIHEK